MSAICSTFSELTDCRVFQRKQSCPSDCPYSNQISEELSKETWFPETQNDSRKISRAYQRLMTGLQIARNLNAFMRFMTLTSPNNPKRNIKKSFAILRLRIERATLEKDGFYGFRFNRYFCLRTSEGNGVLHIVFWGNYIPQEWLKRNWEEIHGAYRVDIRACWTQRRRVTGLVGYLLTNYLTQQPIERMSYGWKWAWLGFCKSWNVVKEKYDLMRCWRLWKGIEKGESDISGRIKSAHEMCVNHSVDAWHCILHDPPSTSRKKKLDTWAFHWHDLYDAIVWKYVDRLTYRIIHPKSNKLKMEEGIGGI